jgi:hypothetical protein
MDGPRALRQRSVLISLNVDAATPHVVELSVRANAAELFREHYALPAASASVLALRLEGAGPAELAGVEERSPGAVTFELFVDTKLVRSFGIPELLAASREAAIENGAREPLKINPTVDYNRMTLDRSVREHVVNPGAQHVTSSVRLVKGRRPMRTNTEFICPSGTSGACNEYRDSCESSCNPSDPGYYELCMQTCLDNYNGCYYGTTTVTENDWFTPQTYLAYDGGWYPWYAIWDIHVWEYWSGIYHHQVYESHYCTADGTYGPYLVTNEAYGESCWIETSESDDSGHYIQGCRIQ